jgi:arylsulfatase A-like enzyme
MNHIKKRGLIYLSASSFITGASAQLTDTNKQPNIIYIMADDLGIGDLGCYGQRFIKTPGIDKLAANGIRFAQHYAGCTVSAPSRCSLMTGKHTGHAYIRGNKGVVTPEGDKFDYPLANQEITVAEIMKCRNYQTACIGKWGMGGPDSEGHPINQGFDYFFGYLGQANAHRYYPQFLFENNTKIILDKKTYSHDLIMEKAFDFIEKNVTKSFFLYLTPTIPHADLTVPNNELGEYAGMFDEKPYFGGGYTAQPKPRAVFAAMISRLDRDVQRIMDLLESKGIIENTIVIFTSDNGTHIEGGHDPFAFDSNGAFRGNKRDMYEGGIRTPFIVHWPGKIQKGTVSYHISAFWDFLPTMCELIGEQVPLDVDGISYLPALMNRGEQKRHNYLYWEFHEQGGKQAILRNNWKLIVFNADTPATAYPELYNLNADPSEQMNVVLQYPEKTKELWELLKKAHTCSTIYPFSFENKGI